MGTIPNPLILDISAYQPAKSLDYDKLAKQIAMVIVRVQYGNVADTEFKNHIAEFQKRGVPVGVYAFFVASDEDDARGEAKDFFNRSNPFGITSYWVDVETATASNMRSAVAAYVKQLRTLTGPDVMIGAYIANHMYEKFNLDTSDFDALWIPAYGANDGTYSGTNPGYACDLHQFTDQGRLNGYSGNLDLSRLTLTHSRGLDYFADFRQTKTPEKPAVATPTPTPTPPKVATPTPTPVVAKTMYTKEDLNLRKGAGTSYAILKTAPKGAKITVTTTSGGWSKATYDSTDGYMSADYLTSTAPVTAKTMYATEELNLRKGAGTSYAILKTAPKGAKVTVTTTSGGWSKATYDGTDGYMSAEYLSATAPVTTKTMYATEDLNLRKGAGTSYAVLKVVPKGAKVVVSTTASGWSKGTYDGTDGYLSAEYLTATAPKTMTTTDSLNLRSGAGTSYSSLKVVPSGTKVTVYSTSGGWAKVTVGGVDGYMSSEYLK